MEINLNRFISKKHALMLKKVGYNEPCFAYYDYNEIFLFPSLYNEMNDNNKIHNENKSWFSRKRNYYERLVLAPTVSDMKMYLEKKGYVFNYDSKVVGNFVNPFNKEVEYKQDADINYIILKKIVEQAIENYCETLKIEGVNHN